MNAYAVHTHNEVLTYRSQRDADGYQLEPNEYENIYEIVIASTPGQARAIVCHQYDLDFTEPMSIAKLTGDAGLPVGTIDYETDDEIALWVQASCVWHGYSDIEEWQQWQGWVAARR